MNSFLFKCTELNDESLQPDTVNFQLPESCGVTPLSGSVDPFDSCIANKTRTEKQEGISLFQDFFPLRKLTTISTCTFKPDQATKTLKN